VNPDSGIRTLASGHGKGKGPDFQDPANIAIDANGHIVVVDKCRQAIVAVDLDTGDRKIVAEEVLADGIPMGPFHHAGIAVDAAGNLLVGETERRAIVKISSDGAQDILALSILVL
jgi:hypothetical protein